MARRKFIKGLYIPGIDGPTETPLRLATDRKAEIERQATWHEGNRLNSVAEELALVAVMRKQQVLMGKEKISVIAAQRQFRKGTHVDETQAAHCLPGQLYLNSFLPVATASANQIGKPKVSSPRCSLYARAAAPTRRTKLRDQDTL